jgi:hypothetical protein
MTTDPKPERRYTLWRLRRRDVLNAPVLFTTIAIADDEPDPCEEWEFVCELPHAAPQPEQRLTVEDFDETDRASLAEGFGVAGRPPLTVIVEKNASGWWQDAGENTHPASEVFYLAREQAATERKVPSVRRFKPGDQVVKNSATWRPSEFDSWGAGEGIGIVRETSEDDLNDGLVDIKWPAGNAIQYEDELLLWSKSGKPEPSAESEPQACVEYEQLAAACVERDQLKQQLASANAERDSAIHDAEGLHDHNKKIEGRERAWREAATEWVDASDYGGPYPESEHRLAKAEKSLTALVESFRSGSPPDAQPDPDCGTDIVVQCEKCHKHLESEDGRILCGDCFAQPDPRDARIAERLARSDRIERAVGEVLKALSDTDNDIGQHWIRRTLEAALAEESEARDE